MIVKNIDGDKILINDPEAYMNSFEQLYEKIKDKQNNLTEEQQKEIERKTFVYNELYDNLVDWLVNINIQRGIINGFTLGRKKA